ncbi:MAG: hypothetical protein K6E11_00565 [Bacilli bacterium]|nr:hypothetical protein [Bacilli bacterium]
MRVTVKEFSNFGILTKRLNLVLNSGMLLYCVSRLTCAKKTNFWKAAERCYNVRNGVVISNRNTTRVLSFAYLMKTYDLNQCLPIPFGHEPVTYMALNFLTNDRALFNISESPLTTLKLNKRTITKRLNCLNCSKGYACCFDIATNELGLHDPYMELNEKSCSDFQNQIIEFYQKLKNDMLELNNHHLLNVKERDYCVKKSGNLCLGLDSKIMKADVINKKLLDEVFHVSFDEEQMFIKDGIFIQIRRNNYEK